MQTFSTVYSCDVTGLSIVVDDCGRVVRIDFVPPESVVLSAPVPTQCVPVLRQLGEYFDGERREFDVELAPMGTEFQMAVWRELRNINYGETISYAALAQRIGKPKAVRAVGAANGKNPIPVIIPCHRVIGADGSMTGFGGGVEVKKALLRHEGVLAEQLTLSWT